MATLLFFLLLFFQLQLLDYYHHYTINLTLSFPYNFFFSFSALFIQENIEKSRPWASVVRQHIKNPLLPFHFCGFIFIFFIFISSLSSSLSSSIHLLINPQWKNWSIIIIIIIDIQNKYLPTQKKTQTKQAKKNKRERFQ